jgi:hypothetical protein
MIGHAWRGLSVKYSVVESDAHAAYAGAMLPWIILMAAAALIAWLAVKPGDCVIRARLGKTNVRGRFPAARLAEVQNYFQQHFGHVPRLRVDIDFPRRHCPLKVRVKGSISSGERQMIRNFLLTIL